MEPDSIYGTLIPSIQPDIDVSIINTPMSNFFIFTSAGKPIYSRYGDEFDLSPVFATFSALIPKLLSFYCNEPFYPKSNFI